MNVRQELLKYIECNRPIIYLQHFDFELVDEIVEQVREGARVLVFSDAGSFELRGQTQEELIAPDLESFLTRVLDSAGESLVVLKDVHRYLDQPKIVALLKAIAGKTMVAEEFHATVILACSQRVIPVELEQYITVLEVPLPREEELKAIITEFGAAQADTVDPGLAGQLAISFRGLNRFEVRQILGLAYHDGGQLGAEVWPLILREKEQMIKRSGLLELIRTPKELDDVGGLDELKGWLRNKAEIFSRLDEARKAHVEIPRGILLVGMPGCGKSLAAKATARLFKVPLVRLDVGKLLGRYVGDSEENMRRALQMAEAISPCVLWVDELEKAFAGVGGGSGHEVTVRLFGYFLTWLQEKEAPVFIAATANDITKLPPEFFRRGRFNELFFVDFPTRPERRKILEIHLRSTGQRPELMDTEALAGATDGFSGADLEAIVK